MEWNEYGPISGACVRMGSGDLGVATRMGTATGIPL